MRPRWPAGRVANRESVILRMALLGQPQAIQELDSLAVRSHEPTFSVPTL